MTMLIVFSAIGLFFFLLERIFSRSKQAVFRRGFVADLIYAPLNVGFRFVLNVTVAAGLTELGRLYLPASCTNILSEQAVWLQVVVLVVLLDFLFYIMHRVKHRWTWWWRLHETHHSSVDLDFFASVRFHPLENILDRMIFLLPLMVLGPVELTILIWSAIDVFFGMFGHLNVNVRLGPLKYIFVGPEMHRWHHVRDPKIRDKNFGNNLSIFDWIFGTAYVSKEEPKDFGVDAPNYPTENIFKQFFFAFRPLDSKPSDEADRPPSEPDAPDLQTPQTQRSMPAAQDP